MIPTALLESLRARALQECADTATILRASQSPDGRGGRTIDWEEVGTVRVQLQSGERGRPDQLQPGAQQPLPQTLFRVMAVAPTSIRKDDRLQIADRLFAVVSNPMDAALLVVVPIEVAEIFEVV
jgi:hypothetical protein